MTKFKNIFRSRKVKARYGIRVVLFFTSLASFAVAFIVAPEVRRTRNFKQLRDAGVVIHPPPFVMFGGPQPTPRVTSEPVWFRIRQKINGAFGISTEPWYFDGSLEIPSDLPAVILTKIDQCADLKAIHEWDIHEGLDLASPPIFDFELELRDL